MAKTDRKSMEDLVYQKLKHAILHRKLAPGKQLVETIISEKLQVSRTPIRNALKKLQSEGLVDIIPNRGAFVVQPTTDEIIQAFEIRKELEKIGVNLYRGNITNKDIDFLHTLVVKEYKAFEKRDIIEYLEINKSFHMTLINKSNNKFYIEFMEKIIDQINIYLILYDLFYEVELDNIRGLKEHKILIEALENHNFETFEKVLMKHTEESLENLKGNQINYRSLNEIF